MDTKEVVAYKQAIEDRLQEAIQAAITEFENTTGYAVEDVNIPLIDTTNMYKRETLVGRVTMRVVV